MSEKTLISLDISLLSTFSSLNDDSYFYDSSESKTNKDYSHDLKKKPFRKPQHDFE